MSKLRILELFGGIGACSKALKRLEINYEIADYVEIDKYAVASFNALHDTHFEPQNICEWEKDIEVDLIMHGSPCQDFSLAGKQAGGDKDSGTRSSLMYETIRIVEKLKPKYVIWENVKNVISKKHIHNFNNYIERLKDIGYTNYYKVLNAKDYGIPQNRERVFTISIRNDLNKNFSFPDKQELTLKLKDMLESEVEEKYYLSDKMLKYISANNEKWTGNNNKSIINKTIASAITTGEGSRRCDASNYISNNLDENHNIKDYRNLKEKLCDKLIEENKVEENDVIRHSYSTSRMNNFYKQNSNNNLAPTLDTRCDCLGVAIKNNTKKGYLIATAGDGVYTNTSTKRGTVQKEMIQTLTTFQDKGVVMNDLRIRKLTPKECWRLMGFDDTDYDKASKVNSNTQLYKQAGNSIVVNVLEAILKELLLNE